VRILDDICGEGELVMLLIDVEYGGLLLYYIGPKI
jgi:hypothetical protein